MARNTVQLKSLKVCAFRSFRRETEIEFGEGINVLVGENGAGKSSVVTALEFALCGDMIPYKSEDLERLRCYYEYKGSRNNPTYVEVFLQVFDNNQAGGRELVIRREFVKNKVTLKIDNKPAAMKDLVALGIRWKDFVVKQGQVAGISNSKPVELLKHFEDLSGAVVLRTRAEELTKSLDQFRYSLQRSATEAEEVQSMLNFVNESRGQREQHKVKDDQRKAIDYIRFVRKTEVEREKLERLRSQHDQLQAEKEAAAAPRTSLNAEDEREMARLEKEAKELSYELKLRRVKEESLEKQNHERFLDMQTYKEIISDLQQKVCVLKVNEQCGYRNKLTSADVEYKKVRKDYLDLLTSKPTRDCVELEYKQQVKRCKSRTSTSEELHEALKSAAAVCDQKILREERRMYGWLELESSRVKTSLHLEKKSLLSKLQDVENYKNAIKEAIKARSIAHSDVNGVENEIRTLEIQCDECKADLLTAEEKSRQCYLQLQEACGIDAGLVKQILEVIDHLQKTSDGFEDKCYGFVIDFIDFEKQMAAAVENALGRKMFCLIVEDVETMLQIQNCAKFANAPSVEFVCLEALEADDESTEGLGEYDNVQHPLEENFRVTSDCPAKLKHFIKEIVMRLCPNVALCKKSSQVAELTVDFQMMRKNIVCATHKGVQFFTTGPLFHCVTPGAGQVQELYLQFRETYFSEEDTRYTWKSLVKELQDKRKVLETLMKKEATAQSSVNLNIYRLNHGRKELLCQEMEVICLEKQEEAILGWELEAKSSLNHFLELRGLLHEACLQVEELNHSSLNLYDEIRTNQAEDTSELQKAAAHKLSELEILRATIIEEDYDVDDENLLSQSQGRDQLELEIEAKRDLLASITSDMRLYETELTRNREEISRITRLLQIVELQKSRLNDHQRLLSQHVSTASDARMQTLEIEISMLEANLLETFKESWKEDVVSSFIQLSDTELYEQYRKIVAEMRKMGQKCAVLITEDQIESYQEEVNHIKVLEDEHDFGRELVRLVRAKLPLMLIAFLSRLETEMRSIYRTINSDREIRILLISANGEEFSLLSLQNSSALQEQLVNGRINGAKFIISGSDGESWSLTELSGGQRSMISLAMILALQKIRPVPFLIFDEVDAALDKPNRDILNTLICHTIRNEKQLICTTFRSELAEIGSAFLHVKFSNSKKTSVVSSITKEEALGAVSSRQR